MNLKYAITKSNIHIENSYRVRTKSDMLETLTKIREESSFIYTRSIYSWVAEWQAHNLLYDLHLFRTHTKDVDLNEDEPCFRLILYYILSLIYFKR